MVWKIVDESAHMGTLIGGLASAVILFLKPVFGAQEA
jgi:hypothetical protein